LRSKAIHQDGEALRSKAKPSQRNALRNKASPSQWKEFARHNKSVIEDWHCENLCVTQDWICEAKRDRFLGE
jgi:hypothetical protein